MSTLGLSKLTVPKIEIDGLPASLPGNIAARFNSRLDTLVRDLASEQRLDQLILNVRYGGSLPQGPGQTPTRSSTDIGETDPRPRYICQEPAFRKDLLVLPVAVRERLDAAVQLLELESLLFDEWGLRDIEPRPKSALNFHGSPGTGKTLAAHALASAMGRKMLCVSYADVESKYHGEGPKNVAALFRTAEAEHAVLFIDEADSLLSKRLTSVTQGSEQAINSMRSQLLISLDAFKGLVIFATNLVTNYDAAFDTRVRHIHFPAPDRQARLEIWRRHLPARLPVEAISLEDLADASEGMVGRDVKNAVIGAAVSAARAKVAVSQGHLLTAIDVMRNSQAEKEGTKLES